MEEKEKLKNALDGLAKTIDSNPCGMGRSMFCILAMLVGELCKFFQRKQYLSCDEAAAMLGISTRTLRRRVKEGKIPQPKHYGHWEVSFLRKDIEENISQNKKNS